MALILNGIKQETAKDQKIEADGASKDPEVQAKPEQFELVPLQENEFSAPKAAPTQAANPTEPSAPSAASDNNAVPEPQNEKEAGEGPVNDATTWEKVLTFFKKHLKKISENATK